MMAASWANPASTAGCRYVSTTSRGAGSYKVYLEDIAVAGNIAAAEMTAGRKMAVLFFDEHNPKEAVVIAVYG
jgi:hypothetical protein